MRLINSKFGMSLLEVMAAVLILGIVVAPLASFFIVSNQRARWTAQERRALSLAEAHIEELRQEKFASLFLMEEEGSEYPTITVGIYTIYTEYEEIDVEEPSSGKTFKVYQVIVRVEWGNRQVRLSTISSVNR